MPSGEAARCKNKTMWDHSCEKWGVWSAWNGGESWRIKTANTCSPAPRQCYGISSLAVLSRCVRPTNVGYAPPSSSLYIFVA